MIPFPYDAVFQAAFYVEEECWSGQHVKWREIIPCKCHHIRVLAVESREMCDRIQSVEDQVDREEPYMPILFEVVYEHQDGEDNDGNRDVNDHSVIF